MRGFADIGSKGHFQPKSFLGGKPLSKGQMRFFQKSAWDTFLDSSRCSYVQKIIKIWCADLQIWCDERQMAEQTDEPESIGLNG